MNVFRIGWSTNQCPHFFPFGYLGCRKGRVCTFFLRHRIPVLNNSIHTAIPEITMFFNPALGQRTVLCQQGSHTGHKDIQNKFGFFSWKWTKNGLAKEAITHEIKMWKKEWNGEVVACFLYFSCIWMLKFVDRRARLCVPSPNYIFTQRCKHPEETLRNGNELKSWKEKQMNVNGTKLGLLSSIALFKVLWELLESCKKGSEGLAKKKKTNVKQSWNNGHVPRMPVSTNGVLYLKSAFFAPCYFVK